MPDRFCLLSAGAPPIPDSWDDPDDALAWLQAALDDTLEQVDSALDDHKKGKTAEEYATAAAATSAPASAAATRALAMQGAKRGGKGVPRHIAGLHRPQERFDPPVDNSNTAFRPRLDHYPHLAASAGNGPAKAGAGGGAVDRLAAYARAAAAAAGGANGPAAHPFETEIRGLKYEAWQLEAPEPQPPREMDETPLVFVDSSAALESMVAALKAARHLAIDLEAHSYRCVAVLLLYVMFCDASESRAFYCMLHLQGGCLRGCALLTRMRGPWSERFNRSAVAAPQVFPGLCLPHAAVHARC